MAPNTRNDPRKINGAVNCTHRRESDSEMTPKSPYSALFHGKK